jgi:putative zinc finger protein
MNDETHNTATCATCDRAEDLIAVLYGEATEPEKRDFELHLKQCDSCRAEFNAFASVRESIGGWRDEALTGFVASLPTHDKRSALAALRQFFALSPLWLKGAVGFAVVVLCVLAAMAVFRLQSSRGPTVATGNPEPVYTKEDVDRMIRDAVAKRDALAQQEMRAQQQSLAQNSATPNHGERGVKRVVVQSSGLKNPAIVKSTRVPKAQRPFSRAEREQLAAELRLLSTDETDLELPDR